MTGAHSFSEAATPDAVAYFTKPDGTKVKTTYRTPAFGSRQFGDIDLTKGTVKGIRSDNSQMAEVIAQGVATGISKARVP